MSAPRTVRLGDGRTLAFAEWGRTGGRPVLESHGNPGSRLLLWDESAIERLGVRMITVDRPGIGRSSPRQGGAVIDWASDVEELIDALEIERLAVLGYSVGGAYAAACAAALPSRVTALALASSIVPLEGPDALAELGRPEWRLARGSPTLARAVISTGALVAERAPALARRAFAAGLPAPDRAVLNRDPDFAARAIAMATESVHQGPDGLVEDLLTAMRPWGFRLEQIEVPTTVWQGDRDRSIPFAWGQRLADAVPGARLRACPGEGHLLLADHLDDVLGELLSS